jgi:flagellar protein FlaG
MTQVKIEQNPPIEVKDKKINEDPPQVEIKLKEIQNVKINTDKIAEEKRILETRLKKQELHDPLQIKNKKDKDKGLIQHTSRDLEEIKKATNEVLAQLNIQLDFTLDKDLHKVVVKVINKETGKVIRQIPPEEMLKIAKRMEEMSGILLDRWS